MRTAALRLARLRVSLGFIVGAWVLWLAEPTRAALMTGAVIACAGEALRFWAAGHLNKSREVARSGPYRWLAHPLYAGSSVMGLGLAVASHSVAVAVIIGAYLATTLIAAIRTEDAFLRRAFGDRYEQYMTAVAAGDEDPAARRPFALALALANREHRAVIGLIIAVVLLALKRAYF